MTKYKFHSTSVDRKLVEPHLIELIDRCGGSEKAAVYASIGTTTIYRILSKTHNTVQHKTASKILLALKRKRNEDRVNRKTHSKLADKPNKMTKMERRIDAQNTRYV